MSQNAQLDTAASGPVESPFVELLHRKGCARMFDAFLANDGFWLTESDLEEIAGINQSTVNRNIGAFQEVGLVESKGSRPVKYRLNEDHPATKPLLESYYQLGRHIGELSDRGDRENVESPFYLLVRTEGRVRIMNALLENDGFWLRESDLDRLADVNQSTVNRHIGVLEEIGLVESRGSRPAEYRLDESHPATEVLIKAHSHLYRDIATLDDYNWEIQEPTYRSTREEIKKSLDLLKVTFGQRISSEATTPYTTDTTGRDVRRRPDHLSKDLVLKQIAQSRDAEKDENSTDEDLEQKFESIDKLDDSSEEGNSDSDRNPFQAKSKHCMAMTDTSGSRSQAA